MLLSLLKILIFFAVVLAIALGAVHLSETGQALRLVYGGTEYTLGPVQLFVALVIVMILAWAAMRLLGLLVATLRFVVGDETAVNRYFARSRERKGYDALAEGMLAVASGEGKLAQDKAAKASKYLNKPHVTDVLAAQAAEISGDTAKASAAYRRLLGDDRTRFVAIRGLMRQKLAEGDTATALKLAEKAYALKPKHRELQDKLLELQTSEGDWKGARQTLKEKRKQGQLPQDVATRRDAVLALQEASEILAEGNSISAREAAISANRASPDLIPAAVLAARSYIAQKDPRNAARVLQKTWSVRPHPALASAYAEIVPDETPVQRLRRFEQLIKQNPNNEESHLLQAELLLGVEDFPDARRALGDLAQTHPTVRTLSILAAVERGEGEDDAIVRTTLTRALSASRGPQWVCDKCQNVMSDWAPVCDSCHGFDTLSWREPETLRKTQFGATSGADMLPLLIGSTALPPQAAAAAANMGPASTVVAAELVEPGIVSESDEPAAPVTPSRPVELARVAPGMVPRESDYVRIDGDDGFAGDFGGPSMTVTDPDPAPAEKGAAKGTDKPAEKIVEITPPNAPAAEVPAAEITPPRRDPRFVDPSEFAPVRPDLEPIDEEYLSDTKKAR
ncbi:heme biosynthesis protein HemY [Paracoccus aminophilus]|uniref:HemY domain-containing protein n=1 Tax=Paracoccus aminophilus JCM 7686 TaxID=1367847 RepID=S5XKC6_PARAH|nr:heme biosynthesis HemY N-terminal domain-containing protein [Paracoccus aminophilus]AGT07654.1 HemY domain-containing protein [Paracoccus aminophilus JCM 7686]